MKTIFKSALLASLVITLGLAGCSKSDGDNTPDENTPKNVFVKMVLPTSKTKAAVDGTTANTPIEFKDGYVVFASASGAITSAIRILPAGSSNPATGEVLLEDMITGKTFNDLLGSTRAVHILGNVPTGITVPTTGNIVSFLKSVPAQVDINTQNFADGSVSAVAVYGGATLVNTSDNNWTANTINPTALVARIEIEKLTLGNSPDVGSYSVTGFYINNYFQKINLDGSAVTPALTPVNNGSTPGNYADGTQSGSPYFGTRLFDYAAAGLGELNTGTMAYTTAAASSTDRWAFNVLAGTQPHIIVRVEDVTPAAGSPVTFKPLYFLTISGFKYSSGSNIGDEIGGMEGGKVYRIANVPFELKNLTEEPEQTKINVSVTIEMLTWEDVPVDVIVE